MAAFSLFALGAVGALLNGVQGEVTVAALSDFSAAEPGEAFPGGAATSRKRVNRDSFSHPSANMSFEKQLDFRIGNGIFRKVWVSAPASTISSDGLGPLYNARSCQGCHLKDGRGHPPAANWPDETAVSMFLRLSIPPQDEAQAALLASRRALVIPEPTYGTQLQDKSVRGLLSEGKMFITYEEVPVALAGGETASLRKPSYQVAYAKYGELHPETMLSPRVAPPMIGLGLLEAVAEDDVLAWADPEDADGDGISGRPNWVWDEAADQVALGRFGWKAGQPNIRQQSAHAFAGDIGISTSFLPEGWGDCTELQPECRDAPHGNTPQQGNLEVGDQLLDLVTFYARHLAVPARRDHDAPKVLQGKKHFYEAGCTGCHRPSFETAEAAPSDGLGGQLIWPYSDLLLHDMGEGLADHRPEGVANGREWRTAPLWGIGLTETVNGHTFFLHDGRARNLLEAILWHGGEAEVAKQKVVEMTPEERQALLTFLKSL